MENQSKYSTGHIFLAALGGAVVGAAAALLLAPKSGRETRQQLNEYLDTAKEKVSRVPEALKSAGLAAKEVMTHEAASSKHHA